MTVRGDWISHFNEIEHLDDEGALALTTPDASWGLSLGGLRDLSPPVAAILAKRTGTVLILDGLQGLSCEAARALSAFAGMLSLCGLTMIDVDVARALGSSSARALFLDGLGGINEVQAAALTRNLLRLSLNGLPTVTAGVARSLCACERLYLDGVSSLSPDAAEVLGSHHGHLTLNGLTDIDDVVADRLASHRGWLSLAGAHDLSAAARTRLASNPCIYMTNATSG